MIWSTYGGGPAHVRSSPEWVLPAHKEWSAQMPGVLEFPPTVVGDTAYTAQDSGWVEARSLTTGSVEWSRHFPSELNSEPTYWKGRLYFEGYNGGLGVMCLDAATGNTIWRNPDTHGESSPVVVYGHVLVGTNDGYLAAYKAATGQRLWRRPMGGKVTGSPTYHDGVVFAASYHGTIAAYTLHGRLLWQRQNGGWLSAYGNLAYSDGTLYGTSRYGRAFAASATTGRIRWITRIGSLAYASPAVADGSVFVSDFAGDFWRLSAATGAVQWHYRPGSPSLSSPVVAGPRVYFAASGLSRSAPGTIYGFRLRGMRLRWKFPDGKYTPVVPFGHDLLVVGFTTLYRFDTSS